MELVVVFLYSFILITATDHNSHIYNDNGGTEFCVRRSPVVVVECETTGHLFNIWKLLASVNISVFICLYVTWLVVVWIFSVKTTNDRHGCSLAKAESQSSEQLTHWLSIEIIKELARVRLRWTLTYTT